MEGAAYELDRREIVECVRAIIADTLRIEIEEILIDSVLSDEFGAESIDFVDILSRIETELKVQFCEAGVFDRLEELMGADVLAAKGQLTELGARVMRERMAEVTDGKIAPGLRTLEIARLYTTRTWVRAALELLNARPTTCAKCGSDRLLAVRVSILSCEDCHTEVRCPTQADLLADWAQQFQEMLDENAPG
jgi:acyl carrier protein